MEQVMNLTFASSLTDLCELNSSFDRGVLRIAYVGDNRNRSSISKQAFMNCIRTMYNCPVVCNYDRETDSLGGHDMQVVRGSKGELRIINATTPIGCIPESSPVWFDTVTEEDGTEHEYLFTEALLWKRQEAYRKIVKDGVTAQSMEITVRDGVKRDDGVLDIRDFEFTAFCLLGDAEPCYESASLTMSLAEDFRQQLSEMMREYKESLHEATPSEEVTNIQQEHFAMEGGERVLHEKTELAAKYGIDVSTLDFDMEEFTLEELTAKFEAMRNEAAEAAAESEAEGQDVGFAAENGNGEAPESGDAAEDTGDESAFALVGTVLEEVRRSLESELIEREWGASPRYCFADCDLDLGEVYAWDEKDWLLYGFKYTMNGDHAVVDFASKKRMKYVIAEFDEGEQESPFAAAFQRMEEALSDGRQWEAKYQTASDTIASMETELGELRQFKADTESRALQNAREEVFARFEDLIGVEAFETLRENCADYSDMEALEEKCYAIRGRAGTAAKFSHNERAPKLKVFRDNARDTMEKEPYGGIFARYGIEAE